VVNRANLGLKPNDRLLAVLDELGDVPEQLARKVNIPIKLALIRWN
jgi:hypothetical protein